MILLVPLFLLFRSGPPLIVFDRCYVLGPVRLGVRMIWRKKRYGLSIWTAETEGVVM